MYIPTNKKVVQQLVKISYRLDDLGFFKESKALLHTAHQLYGNTLSGEFPSKDTLLSVSSLLNVQNIKFALIGGMAVSVHGTPRSTQDIDLIVARLPKNTTDSDYMSKFGFYKSKSSTGSVQILDHKKSGCVELLVANTKLFKKALQTAKSYNLLGVSVPVASPKALIALKITALITNPKRKSVDSADIFNILAKHNISTKDLRGYLTPDEILVLQDLAKTILR